MNEIPNYYSVIPANVRYDKELSSTAKLLYAEITALSNLLGFCFATNKYFADLYQISDRQISKIINALKDKGYIFIEGENKNRKIYVMNARNFCSTDIEQKFYADMEQKFHHNNSSININNNIYNITPEIELPLKDGTTFPVTKKVIQHYKELYPQLDITAEFKKMLEWLNNNPKRLKKDICRFINNWLSSASKKMSPASDNGYIYGNAPDETEMAELKAVLEHEYH